MKTILERWRQYVSEELISEVPLADFGYDHELRSKVSISGRRSPSVGYEQSQDPTYKDKVVKFFDKTNDLWYIIFLKTTPSRPKIEKIGEGDKDGLYERIKQMQTKNKWDPKGKYIVVSFPPFDDDESSPDWQVVHDIIGHTIERYHQASYGTWHKVVDNPGYRRELRDVHGALPKEMQIATDAEQEDYGPDIYAAIFLGKGPAIEDIPEDSRWTFKALQEVVDDFRDKIKEGEFWSFGGWG